MGLKPSVEQARFEYSPLGKIFNKRLDKNGEKERLFKMLENIEGKIKNENRKESAPITNEEELEVLKDESTIADKKPKEIMLLKDKLDFILKTFDSNFKSAGKNFLKKLAKDEKKIDYNNLFFKIEDNSVAKDVNFLKEFGTLYDLLIYLLWFTLILFDLFTIRMTISAKDQIIFLEAINTLKTIISSMKTDIKDQSEEGKKNIFAKQENVFSNAEIFRIKSGELIEQFLKSNIISKDEKFYDAPKKS